jgi:hypothetical protein
VHAYHLLLLEMLATKKISHEQYSEFMSSLNRDREIGEVFAEKDNVKIHSPEWRLFYETYLTDVQSATALKDPAPLYPFITSSKVNPTRSYTGGTYDHLDKYICNWGRALGYDTFIFQHEPDSSLQTRPVTEILDLRPHSEKSFVSMLFLLVFLFECANELLGVLH